MILEEVAVGEEALHHHHHGCNALQLLFKLPMLPTMLFLLNAGLVWCTDSVAPFLCLFLSFNFQFFSVRDVCVDLLACHIQGIKN